MTAIFGESGNYEITIDVPRLIETRLLVQASSGGGKSWALRRLLEQSAKQVQQLIIDPEGEFATLRERFDYIIAAPHDADAIAHPRTAGLLARRLLETGVSAILDIYDLKAHERQAFVRNLCEALVNAPKKLWHPVMVVLDEAHVYAPEKGHAESTGAVIDLVTRGRKRGYCAVLATQRLSKLHKDAAAEMFNKLIGRTGLDVDVKRAADELGMSYRDAMNQLRNLAPGEFYCFGPALTEIVTKVKVGAVATTHPKVGERLLAPPPAASAKIKHALAQLADLPKEAEQEARTAAELRALVTQLRHELTAAKRATPKAPVPKSAKAIEISVLTRRDRRSLSASITKAEAAISRANGISARLREATTQLENAVRQVSESSRPIAVALSKSAKSDKPRYGAGVHAGQIAHLSGLDLPSRNLTKPGTAKTNFDAGNGVLPVGERKILIAIAQHPEGVTRDQITVLTGYKPSSRNTYLQRLRQRGYVDDSGKVIIATTEGAYALGGDFQPLPTGDALREYWLHRLRGGERAILAAVIEAHPDAIERDHLSETTGYKPSSRNTYLQRLQSRKLVMIEGGGVRAATHLFS